MSNMGEKIMAAIALAEAAAGVVIVVLSSKQAVWFSKLSTLNNGTHPKSS